MHLIYNSASAGYSYDMAVQYTDFFSITIGCNSSSVSEYGSYVKNLTKDIQQTRLLEYRGGFWAWNATCVTSISECHGDVGNTYRFHSGSNGNGDYLIILPIEKLTFLGTEYDM